MPFKKRKKWNNGVLKRGPQVLGVVLRFSHSKENWCVVDPPESTAGLVRMGVNLRWFRKYRKIHQACRYAKMLAEK